MKRSSRSYLEQQILEMHRYERVRTSRGAYEVVLDGSVIGAIIPAEAKYGRRAKDVRLTGYPVATWLGQGNLDDMTEALVLHELSQRLTNPARRGTLRQSEQRLL